jgi:hypothetical protein
MGCIIPLCDKELTSSFEGVTARPLQPVVSTAIAKEMSAIDVSLCEFIVCSFNGLEIRFRGTCNRRGTHTRLCGFSAVAQLTAQMPIPFQPAIFATNLSNRQ